jgi:hypothetical protein
VRDGNAVGDHHSCNNYRPGNSTADRIATRRLRHSGSFAVYSPRDLERTGKWVGPQPPGRSDVTLRSRPAGVACLPDEASSTPLEPELVLRIPDSTGSSPAHRGVEAGPEYHHGEAFSPLAPSRSQLDRVPR